jgi:hypothetical protein
METIAVFIDPKKEIEFWLNSLSNPNVDKDSLVLLNKCLRNEIDKYLQPSFILKAKG